MPSAGNNHPAGGPAGQPAAETTIDLATLDAAAAWRHVALALAAAAASSRHPFHLVTVATIDDAGSPDSRTVVLRGFDPERREIRFHTDVRSPKASAILNHPRVSLHWYDPSSRLQIRIPAVATIHHGDEVAREAWRSSLPMSRACYASRHPPGETLTTFPAPPAASNDDSGLARFAVVRCGFERVELLALHARGHQRVRIDVTSSPAAWTILAP